MEIYEFVKITFKILMKINFVISNYDSVTSIVKIYQRIKPLGFKNKRFRTIKVTLRILYQIQPKDEVITLIYITAPSPLSLSDAFS